MTLGIVDRIVEGDLLEGAVAFAREVLGATPPKTRDRIDRLASATPGAFDFGEPLVAGTRHELHDLMRLNADSGMYVQLLEQYGRFNIVKYLNKYWALPLSLGHLNITHEGDQQKPGILRADSLDLLKEICDQNGPPQLFGSNNGYNLVSYQGKFWGIPLAFGQFDLTDPANQTKRGLRVAFTPEELQLKCRGLSILTS